jgi:hypothetical protein
LAGLLAQAVSRDMAYFGLGHRRTPEKSVAESENGTFRFRQAFSGRSAE